ncbi:MAG: hypothetical protein IJK24_01795 [Oscillospiraceae bacterium]|jgi:hypothetical protein|nr:hypothetical protein [Oscillospiraceae bacterium]
MTYQARPGVALVSICKEPVLIPNREAYAYCKRIQKLPLIWALVWDAISMGKSMDHVVRVNQILSKKPEAEVREKIESVCQKLCEMGYLIAVEDDEVKE